MSQVPPLLNQQGPWGPGLPAEGKLGSDRSVGLRPRVVAQGHAADTHQTLKHSSVDVRVVLFLNQIKERGPRGARLLSDSPSWPAGPPRR